MSSVGISLTHNGGGGSCGVSFGSGNMSSYVCAVSRLPIVCL